jgi:glycosyltransferase involved in cell wall biosynthesis
MPSTGNLKEINPRNSEIPNKVRESVSAVIMTKNCEDLVEGTLRSVASWVDEIVVVDGFSTDRTVEICRRFTDKVFQNRWDGYRFCTERNLGNAKASSDWCFHIDPDERATPAFRDAVLKMLGRGTPYAAYEFRKKNFFLGKWMKHGGWYHYSLHLFRRGLARYEGVIHERLIVDGSIGQLEAAVEHVPFTSLSQFVKRHNGYSAREAMAKFEECGILPQKRIDFEIKRKPLKRFLKFYVRKRGFLDAMHGFIFSVLFAWVHFMNWAKYWEIVHAKEKRAGEDSTR